MIQWPFVSRARLDLALHNLEKCRDEASRDRIDFATRYDQSVQFLQDRNLELVKLNEDLLARYHTLRLLGANPAEQHQPLVKAERDIVSEAIIVRSGNNVHLRRHYAEYVTFQRAAGIADVEIAAGILEGESDTDGVP